MPRTESFEDDDFDSDDIGDIEETILERKKSLAKRRVDIRRLIEEREELKLLKEEIGLYAEYDKNPEPIRV